MCWVLVIVCVLINVVLIIIGVVVLEIIGIMGDEDKLMLISNSVVIIICKLKDFNNVFLLVLVI